MFKKIVLAFSLAAPLISFGQSTNVDKIIAKIDNYYILKSEVEGIKARYEKEGHKVSSCEALESMAIQKLLVAKAEIDSVIVENDQIKEQLDARMNQMVTLYGNEKNIVDQFGKSIETLKNEFRTELKEQMTAEKMKQTIFEKVKVTPQEVKKFFESIPKDSLPTVGTRVQLSQIVRLAPVTPELRHDLVTKLQGIKQRIQNGEDFAAMAKEYSEDQGSAANGGDLGWTKRGSMVPEFEAAAMNQDTGKLSDIVESEYGFHLIQTLGKRGQEYRARHILLMPDYLILSTDEPKRYLDSLRKVIIADTLDWNKMVKLHSQDDLTKDAGGIVVNPQTGETWQTVDVNMEPGLYFVVSSLKLGDISAPANYRTAQGKTGMRLIKVIAKKEGHQINLKDDYEELKGYALNLKQNKRIEDWFGEALSEVYINIDKEYETCNLFKR
ncbi:peptidylprolyl isomerase [Leadbetterella sp. DM7]|uniref:peptidylprolyl isomerase n=1 Tax=Leadbetterella sp. DM7 TaxID=3235085 RepID=UPI00349E9EB9